MDLHCWGNVTHGLLGMDEKVISPKLLPWKPETPLRQVASGQQHTLFLLTNGKVYKCEGNDQSEYNLRSKRQRKSPFILLAGLEGLKIIDVVCGSWHSMALSKTGRVLSWGENNYGQLGHSSKKPFLNLPKIVHALATKIVIQIACGNNHSLALTNCGELYSWGSNSYGQLGVKPPEEMDQCNYPMRLTTLLGIPLAGIACGGNHSFLITKSGAVFGWGRNNCGQLGLDDESARSYPTSLESLRMVHICYVTCGDEFSTFLTCNGGVLTCGAGNHGQLGHGSSANEKLPRKVKKLSGITVTQVACGKRHTLAFDAANGRVYSFGIDSSSRCCTRSTNSLITKLPQVVIACWVSPRGSIHRKPLNAVVAHQIFSGGDQCIVTTTSYFERTPSIDMRHYVGESQILTLTAEAISQCTRLKEYDACDMEPLCSLALIFKSPACLNASFLVSNNKHFRCSGANCGLDMKAAQVAFDNLRNVTNAWLKSKILDSVRNELIASLKGSPANVEGLRVYLLMPLYYEFVDCTNYRNIQVPFAKSILKLNEHCFKIIKKWWSRTPLDYFKHMVKIFHQVAIHLLSCRLSGLKNQPIRRQKKSFPYSTDLKVILRILQHFYDINNERKERLQYELFYWVELSNFVDIKEEFKKWIRSKTDWNVCNFSFLLDAAAKTTLLQEDQTERMDMAMASFCNYCNQLFVVVSRDNIVEDSLSELKRYLNISAHILKSRLIVAFKDEEAIDGGGVRKEFFMLLLRNLFDPKYGKFKVFEESRLAWFADLTTEVETYYLIGIICGLAIYNLTIISLPFPLALYKKLLGKRVDLKDLHELSPMEANSLQAILDYNGDDFEENFNLTFEISRDVLGESKSESLKPGGSEIPVTPANKQEFVDLYVDFVLNKSIKLQFNAFYKGFLKICSDRTFRIFQPEELLSAFVGNEEYDWPVLENNCVYRGFCSNTDKTIQWFWEVFHELSEADKKGFLRFLTGSDRVPVEGMKAIQIEIQLRYDDRFLPVAHTCFNILDLPRYKTKEILKYKLEQALSQTQGFGLI